jgi:gamma-glutamyltranspeptidase/glutathione hydrolase
VFTNLGISSIPARGPLPISVPGCVDGWFEMQERFGRLPMEAILEPAVAYAREGFPVSELIAFDWDKSVGALSEWPGFMETFAPAGRAPRKGEIFKNPMLADTLEKIGRGGRDTFYREDLARVMDAFMIRVGGYLRYEDFEAHHSEWVEPVSSNYRGYTVWELPPNGQGIAALQILNILEGYDLAAMGFGSAGHLHHFVEAKKLAFEDRAKFYADPSCVEIPVDELISKDYASRRRQLIDSRRAGVYSPGDPYPVGGDTIYLTVADRERNMVSLIQSNFMGMGSGLCPDGLGFSFQNRGRLFNLQAGFNNSYAPSKRPFHTIIPAFITHEGKPYMSFGVMGGDTQPQAHAQIVLNHLDFGMNLQEAGDAPRIVHSGSSDPTGKARTNRGTVALETGFPSETLREMQEMGHRLVMSTGAFGGYQAILYDGNNDVYFGASESRKDGQAAGY